MPHAPKQCHPPMGHRIEYIVAAPQQRIREWLVAATDGFFFPLADDDGNVCWEGDLKSGGGFFAYPMPEVTLFALAARYTWLFNRDAATLDFTSRFEEEFWRGVGPYQLIRLDELLRAEWEMYAGREWWQIENPWPQLLDWLAMQEPTHWHLLTPTNS
jgi:hypothetical protein